jgi:hypothetical protein
MATATAYTNRQEYVKYLTQKACEEDCSNCNDCGDCKDGCCEEECSCCPTGTVAVYDDQGNHTGCLSPNDAELYYRNTYACKDGLIKVLDANDNFLGCMTAEDFQIYYQTINPVL